MVSLWIIVTTDADQIKSGVLQTNYSQKFHDLTFTIYVLNQL